MNKNIIIALSIVGLIVIAGVGYAVWSVSQTPQVVWQQTPEITNTTNTTNTNPAQAGAPIVQTSSTTAPYISTVVVKGTVNPNGATTTYWYEYGETSALGTQGSNYLAGSGYVAIYTPAYITGLKSNTDYYFRLSAKNIFGTVNGATYSFKTNTTPAPTGTAPTINTAAATSIERTSVNLNGKVNPKGAETTFWFEYGLTSELGAVTAFQSAGSGSSSLSVLASISNMQPLTKYYFRLNANNQFGTANGEIMNFTTNGPLAPAAPTVDTVSATAVTDSTAKLNATVNPNGVATTYWFEYSDNSLLSNVLITSTSEQLLSSGTSSVNVSANINNLDNNTKYYFRVVAKNQYGTATGDMQSLTTKK